MTSDCLNCGLPILFGNLNQVDFCNETCYLEYLKKYPDFEKRGKKGRCVHCGSPHIEVLKKEETIKEAGNVLIEGDIQPRYITIESWQCHNCEKDGQDYFIGEIVTDPEDLEAYKQTAALTSDQNENQNNAKPGRDSENHLGVP